MPKEEKPSTPNAADPQRVSEAGRRERDTRKQQLSDVRELLTTDAGKRFLWRLLEHCKVNESVFSPSAHIYYNSGMQDVGHFVLKEIMEAQPTAYLDMIHLHNKETLNND